MDEKDGESHSTVPSRTLESTDPNTRSTVGREDPSLSLGRAERSIVILLLLLFRSFERRSLTTNIWRSSRVYSLDTSLLCCKRNTSSVSPPTLFPHLPFFSADQSLLDVQRSLDDNDPQPIFHDHGTPLLSKSPLSLFLCLATIVFADSLQRFADALDTLIGKAMDDTLTSVSHYEQAR